MKRRITSLLLCLLLAVFLALPVCANSPLVLDYANLMISEEERSLEKLCGQVGIDSEMDIVLLTVPNLMGRSAMDFADDFYDNNGYRQNGLIFLLDMGSRQWHISTSGTAVSALTDRDLERIENKVIPYFSDGRFYEGFSVFLDILPGYLKSGSAPQINLFLSLAVGAAIAGIVILIMRSTMNTKNPQRSAANYETDGSYHLRSHQDLFLYSNVTKVARPKNNSSGSSTHLSSSGRSHGGRGGRF